MFKRLSAMLRPSREHRRYVAFPLYRERLRWVAHHPCLELPISPEARQVVYTAHPPMCCQRMEPLPLRLSLILIRPFLNLIPIRNLHNIPGQVAAHLPSSLSQSSFLSFSCPPSLRLA